MPVENKRDTTIQYGFDSFYAGNWEIAFESVGGPDPSSLCLMLSGQGAAFPGMFRDQLKEHDTFQEVLAEVDAVAESQNLPAPSDYLRGHEAENVDDLVIVRNLALCAAEVGLFRTISWSLPRPRMVTGFSIGEYAALTIAGVLSVRDMAIILIARDRACPPPYSTGRMIAVAATPAQAEIVLPAGFFVSNLCSPAQTTISIAPDEEDGVLRRLAAAGIRATVLNDVPQPYHTPWLEPASEILRRQLLDMDIKIHPPQLNVISSVSGEVIDSLLTRRQMIDLLARQLIVPVDWVAQANIAWRTDCGSFLELGPGHALGRFTVSTLGERRHHIVPLDTLLPKKSNNGGNNIGVESANPVFKLMQKVTARLTGYEIDSIQLTDRFQEDLGIDSIKKAEILVTVIDEADVNIGADFNVARFEQLSDAVFAMQTSAEEPARKRKANFQRLVEWYEEATLADAGEIPAVSAQIFHLDRLLNNDPDFTTMTEAEEEALIVRADTDKLTCSAGLSKDLDIVDAAIRGFRAWAQRESEESRILVFVTSCNTRPVIRGLAGLFRCLVRELPRVVGKHLAFDNSPDESALLDLVNRELQSGRSFDLSFHNGSRRVPQLVQLPTFPGALPWSDNGAIVAFGGAGGIGLSLLQGLATERPVNIWLAGTREEAQVAVALRALQAAGASVKYRSLDACNNDAVSSFLRDAKKVHGQVELVLNFVGREHSAKLIDQSDAQIRAVLETKIRAAHAIAEAAEATGAPLCLHASSIAARWGNTGQGPYATANQAIVEICKDRDLEPGRCRQVAVNWPPWDNVGMTAQPGISARLHQLGFSLLDSNRASELFREDVVEPEEAVVDYACPKDRRLLSLALADDRKWRPLLGSLSPEGVYVRLLSLHTDPWLNDHSIGGRAVVPAAFSLATAFALGELSGMKRFTLRDHEILNALPVSQETNVLETHVSATSGGFQLQGGASLPHFRSQIEADTETQSPVHIPGITGKFETPYRENALFHGPGFQMLGEVGVSSGGGLVAEIDSKSFANLTGCAAADQMILVLDAGFQLLALAAFRKNGTMVIPSRIGFAEVNLSYLGPGSITVSAAPGKIDGGVRDGIFVAHISGRVLFRVEGVFCGRYIE